MAQLFVSWLDAASLAIAPKKHDDVHRNKLRTRVFLFALAVFIALAIYVAYYEYQKRPYLLQTHEIYSILNDDTYTEENQLFTMSLYEEISSNQTSAVECKCFWQINYPIPSNLDLSQLSTCLGLINASNPYRLSLCNALENALQYRYLTTTYQIGFVTPDPEEWLAQFQMLINRVCLEVLFQLTRESMVYAQSLPSTNQSDYQYWVLDNFWGILQQSAKNTSMLIGNADGICWLKDINATALIPPVFAADYVNPDEEPSPITLPVLDPITHEPLRYKSTNRPYSYYEDYLFQCSPYFCEYFLRANLSYVVLTTLGALGTLFSLSMFVGVIGYRLIRIIFPRKVPRETVSLPSPTSKIAEKEYEQGKRENGGSMHEIELKTGPEPQPTSSEITVTSELEKPEES